MKPRQSIKNSINRAFVWFEEKQLQLLSNKFQNIKQRKLFTLNPTSYDFLDNYFKRFLNSHSHSGVVPGQQLMLVCGAPSIGKTQFIQKNLSNFAQSKLSLSRSPQKKQVFETDDPVIDSITNSEEAMLHTESPHLLAVNIDFQGTTQLSFPAFLHLFEQTALRNILSKVREIESKSESVLDCKILLEILKDNNSEQFLLMYLKDYLNGLVNDLEVDVVSETCKEQLIELVEGLVTISNAKADLQKIFRSALDILKKQGLWKTEAETSMRLCINLFKKIEYEYRPAILSTGYYINGLLSTSFLLDVLNFMAGFHPVCKRQVQQFFDNPSHKLSNNYILKGNQIDCAVVLTNVSKLLCFSDPSFLKWLDHIVLRTYNPSHLRTHIPIVIEVGSTNNVVDLLRLGRLGFECPAVVEIPGYNYGSIDKSNLMGILTKPQAKFLWPYLGPHIRTWIEAIKALSNGLPEQAIKNGEWDMCRVRAIKLRAQINKVFVHQKTRLLHDDNLRWRLAQQLQLLVKYKGNISAESYVTVQQVVEDPVSDVLSEVGVTTNSFYFDVYQLSFQTDIWEMRKIVKQFSAKAGFLSRLKYWRWKTFTHPIKQWLMKYNPALEVKMAEKQIFVKRHIKSPIQGYYSNPEDYRDRRVAKQPYENMYVYGLTLFWLIFLFGYPNYVYQTFKYHFNQAFSS